MNALYPLRFEPIFKDKIWGGQKIKTILGMDFGDLPNCGEVWLLSGVKGDQTKITNGFLAGNDLNEIVEIYMGDLVGDELFDRFGDEFPILIKVIDSNDYLSIQVHPDDSLAAKRHKSYGKTEMWYVNQADEGAKLIAGFNQEMDKEKYVKHLQEGTLKNIMNSVDTEKDDVFFIPAGRVHALGPGLLLTEIQQTSDITYRIYDWDRTDDQGNGRELHTDMALDCIDFTHHKDYKTAYEKKKNETINLAKCPYFTSNVIELDTSVRKELRNLESFVIYICQEGKSVLKWQGGEEAMKPGDCILIPAVLDYVELIPEGITKLLEVCIDQQTKK